ncbi:hypothetical protein JCM8547_004025 [Rhodosporidiobolus lusitaniae]
MTTANEAAEGRQPPATPHSAGDRPGESSLLASLPPPLPLVVRVKGLQVQAPVPQWQLPLVPVEVRKPKRFMKDGEEVPTELLRGVNLEVKPGEVLAIIGGSGSGKTTLLNVLAGRAGNLLTPEGKIEFSPVDSSPLTLKQAKKRIGYVRQIDTLLPYLTVRETLNFAAALRLPRTVSTATRKAIVEQTIMELGLADAADVIVGGAFRKGISGGEKRRLSIGCVLVTLPSILVLDEPTTGLDASTAFGLLETLDRLAQRDRTIILSIHQPRSDAFPTFDKIVLLSQGSVVFSGPRASMLPHFASVGHSSPEFANPLDFVVDLSGIDSRTDEAEEETSKRVGELVLAWREHEPRDGDSSGQEEQRGVLKEGKGIDVEKGLTRSPASEEGEDLKESPRPGVFAQTVLLTRRGFLNVSRNPGLTMGFFLQAVIIGVVVGVVFLDVPETPAGVQSLKTLIYFFHPCLFYLSIVVAVYLLCQELVVFDREREDGLYGAPAWVFSLILSYLPANVVFPTIYVIILYFMTGLRRDDLARNVFSFIGDAIMQQQASWGYALMAAATNRSFAQASLLANGFSIIFVLSAGYLIPHLPGYLRWTRYLSPYFYGFNWLARLQFTGRTFSCTGSTGAERNQCDGLNVLRGLRFNLNTPLWVFPVGLLGFILVSYTLGTLILNFFHPGGPKHAASSPDKTTPVDPAEDAEATERKRIDVVVSDLRLTVGKRNVLRGGKREEKCILEAVDAVFPAGQVSVIMGPSGAGKSSLLQILAGRLNSGSFSDFSSLGSITLNGHPFDSSLSSLVAFCQQEDDHHLPALTVRETLRYAARLRLGRERTLAQCDARAEEVLRMLGLKQCADNIGGNDLLKGISGGEKRRLSLAVELLSDPAVLYADEPLSGLDAYTARNVSQSLRDLANQGRTIVVSVHQPRTDIWKTFDNVLLLAKGGLTAYSGSTSDILKAFEAVGETCPRDFNPADFILDVVSVDHRSLEAEERTSERVSRIIEAWKAKPRTTSSSSFPTLTSDEAALSTSNSSTAFQVTPFYKAFPVVLRRSFTNLYRQSDIFIARLANPPFLALLFWLFFLRLGYGAMSAQTRIGLLQETTALPFVGMLSCLSIFPFEKRLFSHEYKTSARHSATTFLLAYTVQETIVSLLSSFLWSVIFVFGMRLNYSKPGAFPDFWISSFCLISFGEALGIIFCTFTENSGLAVSLVSAGLTLLAQLNGIISATLDHWLKVVGWASPLKPQAAVITINEMVGLVFECSEADVASGACAYSTGEQVLDVFSLPYSGTAKYMGIVVSVTVIWRLIAWALLSVRVKRL